jgi:hypothetical protein
MAPKKRENTPTTQPQTAERPPKTEWIEKAITALGYKPDTVRDSGVNEKLIAHILKEVGEDHRDYFTNGFSVAKSAAMKRLGWEGGNKAHSKAPAAEPVEEATLADLMALKTLASEIKGGIPALLHAVEVVGKGVAATGSYGKLLKCLEAIKLFS